MKSLQLFWLVVLSPLSVVMACTLPMAVLILLAIIGVGSFLWRKRHWVIMTLMVAGLCLRAAAPVLSAVTFRLVWQAQPSPGGLTNFVELTNWCFNVYGTTNVGLPMTNWPFLAQMTNWNLGPTNPVNGYQYYTSGVFTMAPAQYFLFINTSNFSGEVGPSNPAWNAPVPQAAVGNTILK